MIHSLIHLEYKKKHLYTCFLKQLTNSANQVAAATMHEITQTDSIKSLG